MQPILQFLSPDIVQQVFDETFQLLMKPGVKVQHSEARGLLGDNGALVDNDNQVVHIPETVARKALETVPHEFYLYNRAGEAVVHYGGDSVQFDPGSSGVHVLDPLTFEHKSSSTADLVRVIKITEMLSQYDAQSTAIVCNEVPKEIGDLYRLYLVLLYSAKPVVTGAFSSTTGQTMFDMLAIFAGGWHALAKKPLAVFDICPTPPLIWSEFGSQNLIDLACAEIPAQIVSMPLAGAGAPVTLLGSIVQHAAECISGFAIHQFAHPGAPIVWGGAPAIFDMRQGTTPMGAIETAMIDAGYAQVGKSLGLPTHTYLGASDAKIVDAQAGMESGITAVIGALAGINMISGAGMLDFLACLSPEKLVIDAEAIGMAKRLVQGIQVQTETLATELFEGINFKADFLKQKITRKLFIKEQYMPSEVIDRGSIRTWQEKGSQDAFRRACTRANELLANYRRPAAPPEQEMELLSMLRSLARAAGLDKLPEIDLA
jgi:trimethylamine--corrinoid protein Co-methyltransferase